MSAALRTITSLDDIRVGQSVRTKAGRFDWTVANIREGIVTIRQFTNDGRRLVAIRTRRDVERGALRTYV